MTSDPERDLLKLGRSELTKLRAIHESGHDLALDLRHAVQDPNEQAAVVAALYAAVIDAPTTRDTGAASAALGVARGLTGHTDALYRAAPISRGVHAVERSVETGDPRYVERKIKGCGESFGDEP